MVVAAYICSTCGVQYADSESPPARCGICEDERQYIGWKGQQWTTLQEMAPQHRNTFTEEEPGLTSVVTEPRFAIGQRALLLRTPSGNLLWDGISHLDRQTVEVVRQMGGIQAIAICHPHFYGTCVEWSRAFGDAPVFISAADRQWVMRPSPNIVLWDGDEMEPLPGVRLLRLGGHFDGSTVLHWPAGAEGKGALLCGDTIAVMQDRGALSVMYSYPNHIPLSARTIRGILNRVLPYAFDRIYGAFTGLVVPTGAKAALIRSVDRYVAKITS